MTLTRSKQKTLRAPIQIRPAIPSDRPRLLAIQAAALGTQRQSQNIARAAAPPTENVSFGRSGERVFVAISPAESPEGVIVGFIVLAMLDTSVRGPFVDPQYFRPGIGCRLLAQAETEALPANPQYLFAALLANAAAFSTAQGCSGVKSGTARSVRKAFWQSKYLLLLGWLAFGGATALTLAVLGIAASPSWILAALLALGFLGSHRVT